METVFYEVGGLSKKGASLTQFLNTSQEKLSLTVNFIRIYYLVLRTSLLQLITFHRFSGNDSGATHDNKVRVLEKMALRTPRSI